MRKWTRSFRIAEMHHRGAAVQGLRLAGPWRYALFAVVFLWRASRRSAEGRETGSRPRDGGDVAVTDQMDLSLSSFFFAGSSRSPPCIRRVTRAAAGPPLLSTPSCSRALVWPEASQRGGEAAQASER